jgi:phenylacetate-CoA ligase
MISQEEQTRRFFETFMETQWWQPGRLQDLQRENLSKLLRHARRYVPFYAERLDTVFRSDGSIDWSNWTRIPILRREDMLQSGEQMRSMAMPGSHGRIRYERTSGSTGDPVTVATSSYAGAALSATIFRAHRWHDFDWSRNFAIRAGRGHPSHPVAEQLAKPLKWGPSWLSQSGGNMLHFETTVDGEEMLSLMREHQAAYLGARPHRAHHMALEAQRLGIELKLDAIWAFGTATSQEACDDCLAAFDARVVSLYSSKEGQLMAIQCPSATHFHINDETTLLEIVDSDGRACRAGELGRVIVTPIFNFAQPTIRYDHGDMAVAGGSSCVCGRHLGIIERIVGRTTHLFHLPDGRRISPLVPLDIGARIGARFWQVAQTAPLTIEFRYVGGSASPEDRELIVNAIRRGTHHAFEVHLRPMTDLPRTAGGKYLEYVNDYAPGAI